jgi:hypothetical protein
MATKIETVLEDDLSGGPAEETVAFGLDGQAWVIDLNAVNANALRESLVEFIAAARKPTHGVKAQSQRTDKAVVQAMRTWAAENGFQLAGRGRIPAAVVEAYQKAAA